MEWKNIYRGMMMGISDTVPGVSGGTIAVLLGIYDQLIEAINGIFTKQWKKHFSFLVPLVIGIGLALVLFSHILKWLLMYHERPTFYFFLGLIIGVLPFLFRESKAAAHFRLHHYGLLAIGILVISMLPTNVSESGVMEERTLAIYGLLFVGGILASAAMILPGISGSFIFLVLGVFQTIIHAITVFDLKVLFTVGIGVVIGILVMSKIIHFFLQHFRTATFALIIGLVIGSIFVIFPGWATSSTELIVTIIVFACGLFTAYILGKVEY